MTTIFGNFQGNFCYTENGTDVVPARNVYWLNNVFFLWQSLENVVNTEQCVAVFMKLVTLLSHHVQNILITISSSSHFLQTVCCSLAVEIATKISFSKNSGIVLSKMAI